MKTFIFTRKVIEIEKLVVDAETEEEARKIIENNGDYDCIDTDDDEIIPDTLTLIKVYDDDDDDLKSIDF